MITVTEIVLVDRAISAGIGRQRYFERNMNIIFCDPSFLFVNFFGHSIPTTCYSYNQAQLMISEKRQRTDHEVAQLQLHLKSCF